MADEREGQAAGGLAALAARPGATLLLLRAFLGVTFCFAGLEKFANPNFFRRGAAGSFYEQVSGAVATSPLHHLLDPALHIPALVAVVISAGELAVGLGTLAGLFGRVAALGGMALSLSFFLTVSFNDSPYYYGADIVFLFAWTPLLLGGSGWFSLDHVLARRRQEFAVAPGPSTLAAERELERRVFLQRATVTTALAGIGVLLGGLDELLGRHFAPKSTAASSTASLGSSTATTAPASGAVGSASTTTTAPASGGSPVKGTAIGPASAVPVGGAASFTDPAQHIPAYVLQPTADHFIAFSAVCTHAGCTVAYQRASDEFVCPCHGSVFNATTGAVIAGPAPSPLPSIAVALAPDGQLYADG